VGRIRVTAVGSTDSTAVIVDPGKGIRPEDRARAIFALPGYSVNETGEIVRTPVGNVAQYVPQRKKGKSILGTVLGIGAAVLLAGLLFGKNSRSSNVA
jgi:hypothetical protein